MAQSSSSLDQNEQVIVNINNVDVCDKETTIASKSSSEIPSSKVKGSSKKFEVSFEGVLNEAFQQRCKDLANQPSFDAFEQNSWRLVVNKIGRLVSGRGIMLVVIFNEHNFLLRKRVLYFVYRLRRAVQNSLWLGLSLLIWHLVFYRKVEESKSKILLYGTKI